MKAEITTNDQLEIIAESVLEQRWLAQFMQENVEWQVVAGSFAKDYMGYAFLARKETDGPQRKT